MKATNFPGFLLRLLFTWLLFCFQTNISYSQAWNNVGAAGFSTTPVLFTSLAFNGSTPYVAYQDSDNDLKATVMKFNGASWVTVGSAGFSDGAVLNTSLVFNGITPYVAYMDVAHGYKATVMKFDGTNWIPVGLPGLSASGANFTSLAFNGGTPYIAYQDGASGKATVMTFDGTDWVPVGNAEFTTGVANSMSLAFNGSTPYLAYQDGNSGDKATVAQFDGTNWVTVGSAGFSAGTVSYISLAFNGNTPYIAFSDNNSGDKVTVMQFDGTDWVGVGNAGFSAGYSFFTSLVFNGGTPYVAYSDGDNNFTAGVMKFDGTNWVEVGIPGLPAQAIYVSLAFDGKVPYLAYSDNNISGNASVMSFGTRASGLQFDGVDDYVSVPDNPTLDFGSDNFTVECWTMKLSGSSGWANSGVVGKWNTSAVAGTNEWLLQNTSDGNNNLPAFMIESGNTTYSVNGTSAMALNTWYHLSAVREDEQLKLYVNGVLEGALTLPANTTINNVGQNMNVAAFQVTSGAAIYANIRLDELRLWNRALCESEIQNNMNCGLNAAGQSGLVALYGFNQGYENADNSTINTLTDASGNNNSGVLNNFALSGTVSNWSSGNVSSTCSVYNPAAMAAASGGSQVCQSAVVQLPGTIYQDASCNLIAKVAPSGTSPVSGMINACVSIDGTVQTYNSLPYVQRHYDIEPANNATTATGTLTLTFTQAEFDAYNTARGGAPALPTGEADASGIANLQIVQYHGSGTAPGNYTGSSVMIDPDDASIVWNATQVRWEVTFDVTGFSGFYVQSISGPLPVKLLNFTATRNGNGNLLQWTTTEETNTDRYEVERNAGTDFEKIGQVKVNANSNLEKHYTFEDKQPLSGTIYYRLKIVDKDGQVDYSKTATVKSDGKARIYIYPNPVPGQLYVKGAHNGSVYQVKTMSGQVLQKGQLNSTGGINVSALATGMYVLVIDSLPYKFIKK
jgi:hypothetical protein